MKKMLACAAVLSFYTSELCAQTTGLPGSLLEGDSSASARMVQLVLLLTAMSVLPAIILSMTCFTRFAIVFSFLRTGLGLQSTPSTLILVILALFMTFFVMAPTLEKAWNDGAKPLIQGQLTEIQAIDKATAPFKEFMLSQVREKDLRLFQDFTKTGRSGSNLVASEMSILVPAFMISELRRGFEIGLLIILPFLIIDLIVATLVMSMGMMMMPPSIISLPIKILFFILIDGWNLLVGSLLRSI